MGLLAFLSRKFAHQRFHSHPPAYPPPHPPVHHEPSSSTPTASPGHFRAVSGAPRPDGPVINATRAPRTLLKKSRDLPLRSDQPDPCRLPGLMLEWPISPMSATLTAPSPAVSRFRFGDLDPKRPGTAPSRMAPLTQCGSRTDSMIPPLPPFPDARFESIFHDKLAPHPSPLACPTPVPRGFIDILDAQSEIRPTDFHTRLHATGARDYGEDVADRNLAIYADESNAPVARQLYASSYRAPSYAKRPSTASPDCRPHHEWCHKFISKFASQRSLIHRIQSNNTLCTNFSHNADEATPELKFAQAIPIRKIFDVVEDKDRGAGSSDLVSNSLPGIAVPVATPEKKQRKPRPLSLSTTPALRPELAAVAAFDRVAYHPTVHEGPTAPSASPPQDLDSIHISSRPSSARGRDKNEAIGPLISRPSSRYRIPSVQPMARSRSFSTQPVARDTLPLTISPVMASTVGADAPRISRSRRNTPDDCGRVAPRARSIASLRSRSRLDEIHEHMPMKAGSPRHGSFSSIALTASSSSSNPFPRPQSRHTANTSVDLLPLSATVTPRRGFQSPVGDCGSPSPPSIQRFPAPPASEASECPSYRSRTVATYANGAFNLDDYATSSEDELTDFDVPLASIIFARRRQSPKDDEGLLFSNFGYGAGHVAQLPGLFEPLPDAVPILDTLSEVSSCASSIRLAHPAPPPAARTPPIPRSSSSRLYRHHQRFLHDSPARFRSLDMTTVWRKANSVLSTAGLTHRLAENEQSEVDTTQDDNDSRVAHGNQFNLFDNEPDKLRSDLALGRPSSSRTSSLGARIQPFGENAPEPDRGGYKLDARRGSRTRRDFKTRRWMMGKFLRRPIHYDTDEEHHTDFDT